MTTNLIDSLLDDDLEDAVHGTAALDRERANLPSPLSTQLADHVIVEPSSDEWVTMRDKSIAGLPRGSIVRGLAHHSELNALINQGVIRWRGHYAGPFSGVVHHFINGPAPCRGPRCCEIPRLRADERFENGLQHYQRVIGELRAKEQSTLEAIENAISDFDGAAKQKVRDWSTLSGMALGVLDLQSDLAVLRAELVQTLKDADNVMFGCFDTLTARALGVPIEKLGLERRPISCEHVDGKLVLQLFNGERVEVRCG